MSNGQSVRRWFLVPVVLAASTVAAWGLGMGLMLFLYPIEIRWAAAAHLNFPPSDLLSVAGLLAVFLILAIWVVPVAWAVGFAMRARAALAVLWGFSICLLLTAAFVWFRDQPFSRTFAIAAGVTAICAIIFLAVRKLPIRVFVFVEAASFFLLFVPSLLVLASLPKQPPAARKVWSVALQIGTGQSAGTETEINNGSLLAFAGERIVIADATFGGYDGGKPMSRWRVVSLDQNSGAGKSQVELTGPYNATLDVFGTRNGKVALADAGVIRLLNPDLSETGIQLTYTGTVDGISPDRSTLGWKSDAGMTLLAADTLDPKLKLAATSGSALITSIGQDAVLNINVSGSGSVFKHGRLATSVNLVDRSDEYVLFHGECGAPGYFLGNRVLISGCGKIRILNDHGKVLQEKGYSGPGGLFAGVSQDGRRFALEFSDELGDPSVMLYQRFAIYNSATAAPIATVLINLPERQSWSAFSPDGHLFAVGNPDKVTLYAVP